MDLRPGTGRQQSRPWDSTAGRQDGRTALACPCTMSASCPTLSLQSVPQCHSWSRVWTVCGAWPGEQNTASARREGEGAEQQALVAQNGSVGGRNCDTAWLAQHHHVPAPARPGSSLAPTQLRLALSTPIWPELSSNWKQGIFPNYCQ